MNDLIFLSFKIDSLIKQWLEDNYTGKKDNYDDCVQFVLNEMMIITKGSINPKFLKQMILLHKKPFLDYDIFIPAV